MPLFNKLYRNHKTLSVHGVNPYFGVEICNLPSIHRIKAFHIEKLKSLVLKYGLVILRGNRHWSESEQVELTKRLGKLDAPTIYSSINPSDPSILKKWPNVKQSGLQWHSDRSYHKKPSYLSIFQMIETPSSGNRTSFLSLIRVYDNLPEQIKRKWANYKTIYAFEKVVHPLFWVHPFTGVKTLYFDFRFASEIVDPCNSEVHLEVKDINKVMQIIAQAFAEEKAKYHHIWQKGDLLIVDNYSVAHKTNIVSENGESKVLIRTTTEGIYF
ncbi:TauD/TfdA dioxygenase family protein [Aquimarina sp. 2304DJ70-9]|uniref:TauD/TfdA dioxygenase family protein n=1 Tax=Aquimarina penaris TaxID=3231044 RepID=UPI003462F28B